MVKAMMPICYWCRWYDWARGWECKAFPDGIPDRVAVWGKVTHRGKLDGQEGDFVFEKADGETLGDRGLDPDGPPHLKE